MKTLTTFLSLSAFSLLAAVSSAQTFPFLESFDSDNANWTTQTRSAVTHVASGGADGDGYITDDIAFADGGAFGLIPFRGEFDASASDRLFAGDWIASGVEEVSFSVRHNAPIPLAFSARFASPFNFPGSSAISFAPVAPGVFTELSFAIEPSNPQFVTFEGSDFATVFSNVGNLQVTASLPASFVAITQELIDNNEAPVGAAVGDVFATANGLPVGPAIFNTSLAVTFDLDEYAITAVPEPASLMVVGLGLMAMTVSRRR